MTKFKLIIGLALSLGLFSGSASAVLISSPMDLNDEYIVGIIDTTSGGSVLGNEADEALAAQALLNLAVSGTATINANLYSANTFYDYSGTLTDYYKPSSHDTSAPTTEAELTISGYDFVMAKYDGPNAGYVLFSLVGLDSLTIPQFPTSFWTSSDQYAISHWTAFNANTTVPEPGILALMAIGLLGVVVARRKKTV